MLLQELGRPCTWLEAMLKVFSAAPFAQAYIPAGSSMYLCQLLRMVCDLVPLCMGLIPQSGLLCLCWTGTQPCFTMPACVHIL